MPKKPARSKVLSQQAASPGQESASRSHHRLGRRSDDSSSGISMIWLVSFTDIMALMLTFFVLLFSMSTPEQKTFADMTAALHNELRRFYGRPLNPGQEDSIDVSRIDYDRALDIRYLEALMESMVARNEALKTVVTLMPQGDHLMMSLPQDLLFDVGKAELKPGSARALFALGGTFSRMKNSMEFIGHADPRPVEGGQSAYESNWDLSLARAVAVAAALDKVGYNQPVAVRGASSGRYQDLQGIVDENQRLDLSRRVDIDIMDHDGRRKKVVADFVTP